MTFPTIHDYIVHWVAEDQRRAAEVDLHVIIASLLRQQIEACAAEAGSNVHCAGCEADHLGDDIAAKVRETPIVEF